MGRWIEATITAAHTFDMTLQEESQFQATVSSTSKYPPPFCALLSMTWVFLASGGRAELFRTAMNATLYAGPLVQYLVLLGSWVHVFALYRQRLLRMRRGDYFFERKHYREEAANKFVGYQVAGMTCAATPLDARSAHVRGLQDASLTLASPHVTVGSRPSSSLGRACPSCCRSLS